jgi:hypothetical protein
MFAVSVHAYVHIDMCTCVCFVLFIKLAFEDVYAKKSNQFILCIYIYIYIYIHIYSMESKHMFLCLCACVRVFVCAYSACECVYTSITHVFRDYENTTICKLSGGCATAYNGFQNSLLL